MEQNCVGNAEGKLIDVETPVGEIWEEFLPEAKENQPNTTEVETSWSNVESWWKKEDYPTNFEEKWEVQPTPILDQDAAPKPQPRANKDFRDRLPKLDRFDQPQRVPDYVPNNRQNFEEPAIIYDADVEMEQEESEYEEEPEFSVITVSRRIRVTKQTTRDSREFNEGETVKEVTYIIPILGDVVTRFFVGVDRASQRRLDTLFEPTSSVDECVSLQLGSTKRARSAKKKSIATWTMYEERKKKTVLLWKHSDSSSYEVHFEHVFHVPNDAPRVEFHFSSTKE